MNALTDSEVGLLQQMICKEFYQRPEWEGVDDLVSLAKRLGMPDFADDIKRQII